jgi:hypothetical protein
MEKLRIAHDITGRVVRVDFDLGAAEPIWVPLPWDEKMRAFVPQTDRDREWLELAQALPEFAALDLGDRPPDLAAIRAAKISELSDACQATIMGGFHSTALGANHRYSSEEEDQANLVGAVNLVGIMNQSIPYTCTNLATGEKRSLIHTPAQIRAVFLHGAAHKQFQIARFHAMRVAIEQSNNPTEVQAMTW